MSLGYCTWCGTFLGDYDEIMQLVIYDDKGYFFCSKKCLYEWNNAEGRPNKKLEYIKKSSASKQNVLKYSWNNYDGYFEHGFFVNMQEEKYELAIMDFTESIKLYPNKAEAYIQRGNAYRELSQWENAFADYKKVMVLDPKNISAYMERAFCYQEQSNDEMAISDFTKAINIGENSCWVYFSRGLSYYGLGKYNLLKDDFANAINRDTEEDQVKEEIKNFLSGETKTNSELRECFCDFEI